MMHVTSHQAWKKIDLEKNTSWIHILSSEEIDELIRNTNLVEIDGQNYINFSPPKDMIRIHTLIAKILFHLTNGFGAFIVKNVPVNKKSREIFWLLSMFLGNAAIQTKQGCLLYDIINNSPNEMGKIVKGEMVRGTKTNDKAGLHTDPCNILGMFCLESARSGGETSLSSPITIHNEILKHDRSLLKILYEPFFSDRQLINLEEYSNYSLNPYFKFEDDTLKVQCNRLRIDSAQKNNEEIPRLSSKQIKSLDLFDEIGNHPDNKIEFMLNKGDVIYLNNNLALHGRNEFEDDLYNPRHILRIWLSNPKIISMPSLFGYPI